MNTAMIAGAQGLAFALEVDLLKGLAGELIRDGRIRRSHLGVGGQTAPIHRSLVRHYALAAETGVVVRAVEDGSPAQKAGLREGDLIVSFDGAPVVGIDDLHRLLTAERAGVAAPIQALRHTELVKLEIVPREG